MKDLMKYLAWPCMVLCLAACQTNQIETPTFAQSNQETDEENTCFIEAENVEQALNENAMCVVLNEDETRNSTEQGVLEVIHPVEEVEVPLEVSESAVVEPATNVWEVVRTSLEFEIPENQRRLTSQKNWYLKHPKYMQRVSKRAKPFLFYIVEQLEEEDMPLDLALLPIVESAFDPFAYSHGRASGMWQFIPATGKRFGMKQTWWFDGRRDVITSTDGAIKFLKYLHKRFDGDWLHALAAYNSGEGRVRRAINKNKRAGKPTDFWSLSLPKETRAYVPKLLALVDILKNHEEYGFDWPHIANTQVVQVVDTNSQIDLALAANMADLSIAELQALNPGFNRWATDPAGPHRLLLPIEKAMKFQTTLAETSPKDQLKWVRHKVKNGESLGVIANKYNSSISLIKRINSLRSNTIYVNDYILVPVSLKSLDEYSLSLDQRLAKAQNKNRDGHKVTHVVRSGDTLWDIARDHKVGVRSLAKWNNMAPTDPLKIGTKLVVWTKQATVPSSSSSIMRNVIYTVRSGDSLARIANKFKVRVSDLTRWNNLNAKKYLQPGQKLKIKVDVTRT